MEAGEGIQDTEKGCVEGAMNRGEKEGPSGRERDEEYRVNKQVLYPKRIASE